VHSHGNVLEKVLECGSSADGEAWKAVKGFVEQEALRKGQKATLISEVGNLMTVTLSAP
jgi:hypothetical protein